MTKFTCTKKELKQAVLDGLSAKQISIKYNCSKGLVEYFKKKWNCTSTILRPHDIFLRRKYITSCSFCKKPSKKTKCCLCAATIRHYAIKIAIINYLGGKCTKCGYDKCITAIDFHHIDPSKKNFNISEVLHQTNNLYKTIMEIYNQCILLCSNCHRELHMLESKVNCPKYQKEIEKYIIKNKLSIKIDQCCKKIIEPKPLQQY